MGSAFEKVHGTWKVDLEAFKSFKIVKDLKKNERDRALTLAKEIRLTVNKDNIKATFDQKSTTGTFKLVSHKDGLFTLETEMTSGKKEQVKMLLKDAKLNLQTSQGSLPLVKD